MFDPGAVLVIVVLAALQPIGPDFEGFFSRSLSTPTATVRWITTLAACEDAAERYREDLEDRPLPGRTVKVFCVTP